MASAIIDKPRQYQVELFNKAKENNVRSLNARRESRCSLSSDMPTGSKLNLSNRLSAIFARENAFLQVIAYLDTGELVSADHRAHVFLIHCMMSAITTECFCTKKMETFSAICIKSEGHRHAGSGKTLISVMLVKHFAEKLANSSREARKKIFFLAPKAELVRQARHTQNLLLLVI